MKNVNVFSDDFGNKIIAEPHKVGQKISLHLTSETKKRLLGYTDVKNKTFVVKRNRGKHLFRNANAYGFNHYLLDNTKKFETIMLMDEHQSWRVPVRYILENGFFLNFKQQGFERQIFLSLDTLNNFTINTF